MADVAQELKPVIIGCTEFIALPDWGVQELLARVDTGAKTSALHVKDIIELPRGRIRFTIPHYFGEGDQEITATARIRRLSKVRSSNGVSNARYFVKTTLKLGHVERKIEVSLVNRGKMKHRMLLGRNALSDHFLVDVSRRILLTKKKRKKKKKGTSPHGG